MTLLRSKSTKNRIGRPPAYQSVEELQAKINEYFERGVNTRAVVVGSGNNKQVVEMPCPTITGLVLYLGFCDRQSFYAYENKPLFNYTIKKARSRIEQVYEELLHAGLGAGAIFALKNFGWVDKTEIQTKTEITIKVEEFELTDRINFLSGVN